MRSTSFRTARRRVSKSILHVGAGVVILGLALSASARDASPSARTIPSSETATNKIATKASKKRNWLQIGVASWYGTQFQGRKT